MRVKRERRKRMKVESFRKRKERGEVDSGIRALGSLEMKRMGKIK